METRVRRPQGHSSYYFSRWENSENISEKFKMEVNYYDTQGDYLFCRTGGFFCYSNGCTSYQLCSSLIFTGLYFKEESYILFQFMYLEVVNCSEARNMIEKLTNGACIVVKPSPSTIVYEVNEMFPVKDISSYWWFINSIN